MLTYIVKRKIVWSQNFVPIPCFIKVIINDFELGAFLVSYSAPYPNSAPNEPIFFLYARIQKSVFAPLVDTGSAIVQFLYEFL